jgi:hypothetical protein
VSEEVTLEAQAVELAEGEAGEELAAAEPVRRLPARGSSFQLEPMNDVTAAALVAAGGVVAGAATVAAVRAVRVARTNRASRKRRASRRDSGILASRSFLVDVHVLGR